MLRFLYTILDLFSTVFALLSPVAIVHWLLTTMRIQGLESVTKPLDALFNPLNAVANAIVPLPPIHYQGQEVPISQAVIGALLTVLFFICTLGANFLKSAEKKLSATKDSLLQQRRLQALNAEQNQAKKRINRNSRVLVYITYPFSQVTAGADQFNRYDEFKGRMIPSPDSGLFLTFDNDVESALKYVIEAARNVLGYYATLRPMDPQPPFQIVLHATDSDENDTLGLDKCRLLSRYAGGNQTVFSGQIKALLDAKALNAAYKYQSVGYYDLALEGAEKSMELFVLLYANKGR